MAPSQWNITFASYAAMQQRETLLCVLSMALRSNSDIWQTKPRALAPQAGRVIIDGQLSKAAI
jgi:hypothetical protein